jgi:hypothetical protein
VGPYRVAACHPRFTEGQSRARPSLGGAEGAAGGSRYGSPPISRASISEPRWWHLDRPPAEAPEAELWAPLSLLPSARLPGRAQCSD